MIYLAVFFGIALIAVVVCPFFVGEGGRLAASASINSIEDLDAMKLAVANRYLEDERAFKAGSLGQLAWDKRKQFLVNRYIDAARRRDFLEHLGQEVSG